MKKIFALIIAVAVMQSLSAQDADEIYSDTNTQNEVAESKRSAPAVVRERRAWVDLQVGQHVGLNNWSDAGYANDGLPSASVTEVRGGFSFFFGNWSLGAFFDMGVGIMPGPDMKSFDLSRFPMPNSGTQYHLRETTSETGSTKTSAHFKFTTGLFFNIPTTDKLSVMPYLGVGGMSMSERRYDVVLKEQDSNMQYNTTYQWGKSNDNADDSNMLTYLSARVNLRYKIGTNTSLLFGLEYTYFMETFNFYGKYTNEFNGNIQREFKVKGNKLNMLGLTVGVSFR